MSLLLWTRVAHFGGFSTLERTGAIGETVVNSFCSGFMDGWLSECERMGGGRRSFVVTGCDVSLSPIGSSEKNGQIVGWKMTGKNHQEVLFLIYSRIATVWKAKEAETAMQA